MKRHALALLSVLLMGGCATTPSNYYSYEGSGDYYYGASAADVVIDYSGYGYGYGFDGYGAGFGYGYGYGYLNPWWGYGYQPIWSPPSYPHDDAAMLRNARVQYDRAARSSLVRRDTLQAPDSAKWFRDNPEYQRSYSESRGSMDARATRSSSARRAVNPQSRAPIRQAPVMQSRPAPSRSASMPAPVRHAPSARPTRKNQ